MVAYSFKLRFVANIQAGLGLPMKNLVTPKLQTIRNDRKPPSRHARPGEEVQLYHAQRTKHAYLIGLPICTNVSQIEINFDTYYVAIDGGPLVSGIDIVGRSELDKFARMDGFGDWTDMREFWAQEHPGIETFSGVLIRWKPATSGEQQRQG